MLFVVVVGPWWKETAMQTLFVGLALFVAGVAGTPAARVAQKPAGVTLAKQEAKKPAPADPNVAVAKEHGGKVWVLTSSTPSAEGEALAKWLAAHPSTAEVTKKPSEERWPVTLLAVFKKPPAKGALTVEFLDKKDPRTLVDQYSTQSQSGGLVFQEPYDLDTNNGFNKGRTYIIRVGQLINKKFVGYATGEVSLK
jgi:hypothetical protein